MANLQDIKDASTNGSGRPAASAAANSDQALSRINRDLQEKATQESAKELKLPYVDVAGFPINPDILHLLPEEETRRTLVMPFYKSGKQVRVAVSDPKNPDALATLKTLEEKGYTLQIHLASGTGILEACKLYATEQYKLKEEIKNVVKDEEIHFEKELTTLAALKDQLAALPAEEALNMLNVSAIKAGASDIHYQPEETSCTLRFRIDGVLHNVFEVSKEVYGRIANQLKYKASMKLNVTTIPQDGRFRFIVNERKIDVRASTIPTEYGEAIVCRILDTGKHFATFEELGFSGRCLKILQDATELAQGMILVTGPTSSGKTTTLYVLLSAFNKPEYKIITLEDPVEYHLKGITQSQINEKRSYDFAAGLRSILRQDPDIVMIGEIRDLETAQAATQAALTGHVMLSTLHTNSAVESIPRLTTIGLQPFMVAPALSLIIAQRLVRKLCTQCVESRQVTAEEKTLFEKTLKMIQTADATVVAAIPEQIKKPHGCEACNMTGFRGQMVICEILVVDDEIEQAILQNKSAPEILTMARGKGMLTMAEDAVLKVIAGHTTLEEIHRVINT